MTGSSSPASKDPVDIVHSRGDENLQLQVGSSTNSWGDEELLRLLVHQVQDLAIIALDVAGNVVSWNAGAERLLGYGKAEIYGSHLSRFYPTKTSDDKPQLDLQRAASGRLDADGLCIRKDETEFWASILITPLSDDADIHRGFAVIMRDITTVKRQVDVLHRMVELSLNAIVKVNAQGEIVMVNSQTERMFGYTRDQLVGQSVEMLVPDRFKSEHPKNRDDFFAAPKVRPMGAGRELYGRRSDGTEFPIEIGLSPFQTLVGPAALASIVDITARKQAEQRERKYLADLAHVARLSTVGQMFSELAHEINQPLAAAANYARACVSFARSRQGATQDELIEWMEKTVAQTTRAIDIVKRLGSFVKKDGGTRMLVHINRLIEQVVLLSVPAMQTSPDGGESVRLDLILDEEIPLISVDSVQIEQVLLNLVRNAIEAMQSSSVSDRRLTLQTTHDDGYVHITVADTGPGISDEQLARLFDPYFTTKATGIGLGLSISRSIVEDHAGEMTVDSSHAGTTFRFTLPLSKSGLSS